MANLENHEPFAKIFLADTWKIYMANVLTVAFLPNFSLPIVFTCVVCQNFPYQIFPMYGIAIATSYLINIPFVHDTDVNYDHVLYYFCIWNVAKTDVQLLHFICFISYHGHGTYFYAILS